MEPGPAAPTPVAPQRGAWAGGRWWLPGTTVALGAALLGGLLTEAWYAFEAADCGNPGATFACLGESLLAGAAVLVLGPLALWSAYRRAGVRRAWTGVLVAAAVAFCLLALVELVAQVGVLSGRERTFEGPSGLVVGGVLGLAVLGGGLVSAGPRRRLRAVAAALALGALVGTVLLLQEPVERAATRLELARAQVPLLVPAGWQISSPYVGGSGDLSYDAVPGGWDGDGFAGVDVDVTSPGRALDSCSYVACRDDGDVRLEVPDGDTTTRTAWRVVDGVVVTARTYSDRNPEVDLADLLRSLEPTTIDEVVDRSYLR